MHDMKYKVGDTVKLIDRKYSSTKGLIGVIKGI